MDPLVERYDWSDDNRAELAKGWIKQAETITDLAQTLGLLHHVAGDRQPMEYTLPGGSGCRLRQDQDALPHPISTLLRA